MLRLFLLLLNLAMTIGSVRLKPHGEAHVPAAPWPQGRLFPFGTWEVYSTDAMDRVKAAGFNMIQTYGDAWCTSPVSARWKKLGAMSPDEYLQAAADRGLSVVFSIGTQKLSYWCEGTASPAINELDIQRYGRYKSLGWWSIIPEEAIWRNYDNQSANIQQMIVSAETLRRHDPAHHPIYIALVPDYDATDLRHYTPYIDAVGTEIYPSYAGQPGAWVRYQVEQEIEAIDSSSATARNRTVFPIALLQQFPAGAPMTGADARHNVFLALVAGARAIHTWNDADRDAGSLNGTGVYANFSEAALQINGADGVGEAFLFGTQLAPVATEILSGPRKSAAFTTTLNGPKGPCGDNCDFNHSAPKNIQYDSISTRAVLYDRHVYLAAVNSADAAVSAAFRVPRVHAADTLRVLWESRTTTVNGYGRFQDTFCAKGVHVYKIQVPDSTQL